MVSWNFQTAAFLTIVLISLSCSAQPVIDPDTIVQFINRVRTSVTTASNIKHLSWDGELAGLAQEHADGCSLVEHPLGRVTDSQIQTSSFVGESHDVSTMVASSDEYIQDVLEAWEATGDYYDFDQNICSNGLVSCGLYTQLVWAETSRVGCGVNVCNTSDSEETYFFVCNFLPGGNLFGQKPYTAGEPCSGCGSACNVNSSLCVDDDSPDMMTGSDPHFSVRLPSGQLLCFTVQGEVGMSFNLISTNKLEMNALFIRLPSRPKNTWLGAIGITVTGKQLVFNSTAGTINIDNKMELASSKVKKIRVANKRLYLTTKEDLSDSFNNQVEVDIDDLGLRFTVVFVRNQHLENQHLDMLWNSGGMDTENVHGLLGQFLHPAVMVDEGNQLLILPGRPSVPVVHKKLFAFIQAEAPEYKAKSCWTAKKRSNQGVGVIEGAYTDYEVSNLLSTGFNFGVANGEETV